MESKEITKDLSKNEEHIKNVLGQGNAVNYRKFIIPVFDNCEALVVNINGMTDTKEVDEFVIKALMEYRELPKGKFCLNGSDRVKLLLESGVFTTGAKVCTLWREVCDGIVSGDTILLVDKCETCLILSTRKYNHRAVQESNTESEIRGPRDGFIEFIQTNITHIRRRIRDHDLRFEMMQIGRRTKTDVAITYIESLVNQSILDELKKRLKRIDVDSILSEGYLEEFIEDSPYSVIPQIEHTERPDKVCSAILEGRIGIVVDNTPFALIVPTSFWSFMNTSGDYYERFYIATFLRWIRLLGLFLCVSLSSLYVLSTSFHQEMIPTTLAIKIAEGRLGVPFPSVIEAFFMELILDIMKEAGLRLPKAIGQSVSIVGTIIIGQVSIQAGLIGPALGVIVALAAVCSYAVPSHSLSNSMRLVRYTWLFATALFGLLGYLAAITATLLYICSLRSFGEQFLAPVIPFEKSGFKDVFIRAPWWAMSKRPRYNKQKESSRQAKELEPKPPSTN